MARDEMIREQAVVWAVRTGEPGFDGWDEFTLWLEADPAHPAAYDRVLAAVDDAAVALPPVPEADNDDVAPRPLWRRRGFGGAVTAALAVVAFLGVWQARGGTYAVETLPGEVRVVDLGNSEQIAVAGDTRIVLDRNDPRVASLERGQALFTLGDHSKQPFKVTVGEDTLVDIGTVFEVEHGAGRMSVAVSEGAVLFNPGRQNVRVTPGERLTSATGSDSYDIASIAPGQVGEWREGRITFQDATLEEVAGDLARATGVAFSVSARSPHRRVSGSLLLEPVRKDPRQLGPLLGVTVRYTDGTWEIGAR